MATKTEIANLKRTAKYKALIAIKMSPDDAVNTLLGNAPAQDDPREAAIADLMSVEFTRAEAEAILASGTVSIAEAEADVEPEPAKSVTETMVDAAGLNYARGRVYVTIDIIKAVVQVTESGEPAIVKTSGKGRTKAVLINREASGDTSIQNLA